RFDVFFRNQLSVFQQHQDESLYDSWTHFKDIIRKVLNHGLSIWTLIKIFLKYLDSLSRHIINLIAEGDLKKFSDIRACNEPPFALGSNEPPLRSYQLWKKTVYEKTHKIDDMTELPKSQPKKTYEEDLESEIVMVKIPRCMAWLGSTNAYDEPIGSLDDMTELPKSQPKKTYEEDLESEIVMVKIPRCMAWLGSTNAYDEPIGSLGMIENKVGNASPQSSPQAPPSFEEYTPPVTYPEEVEETIGSLGMIENKVGNASPQSSPQAPPSFEEYTPPVTYPEEVEETIGGPHEFRRFRLEYL
nr:hypothetical protein [Tanacetum cinerariifolium]